MFIKIKFSKVLFLSFIYAALGLLWQVGATLFQLLCTDFSLRWFLLLHSTDSGAPQSSVVVVHGLSSFSFLKLGLVALQHVVSPLTKDGSPVLCICRLILNHWTNREVHNKV